MAEVLEVRSDAPLRRGPLRPSGADPEPRIAAVRQDLDRRPASAPPPDPDVQPCDPAILAATDLLDCLRHKILPWRRLGGRTVVLAEDPERAAALAPLLRHRYGPLRLAPIPEGTVARHLLARHGATLARRAETRCPEAQSSRTWRAGRLRMRAAAVPCLLIAAGIAAPAMLLALLLGWSALVLAALTALRIAAVLLGPAKRQPAPRLPEAALPAIAVLVPLYRETAIAGHLLARLRALDYPRDRLDLRLVLEDDDATTRATLATTELPPWVRPLVVPEGTLRTKPRALNFALPFIDAPIVGVWDAEDAPAPDQLLEVAARFAHAPHDVACLQGRLDYYNAGANWLTRCFTLEYAGWFRTILPALERLGLVLPLGGTTLFLRREVLEALGGWDAHNVTEDADLGLRLGRAGYRTELLDSVTGEEANGLLWPWVRQRSRWIKGYAMTYAVHMRDPGRLWSDLGGWRFLGVQLLFLGTLSQVLLAPLLWMFWFLPLAPGGTLAGAPSAIWALAALFIASELASLAVVATGLRRAGRLGLLPWALTLPLYFPLASLAAWKAVWEMMAMPFFWDKTAHGLLLPDDWAEATPPQAVPAE